MYFASKNNYEVDLISDDSFIQVYLLSLCYQLGSHVQPFPPCLSLDGLPISLFMLHLLLTLLIDTLFP